jgi:4'-phosphopantetheinyl transferase
VRGHHGKPALADVGGGGLQFSVSRSDDCCLIALTKIGPVGVDVERVVPRTRLDEIVANRFAPAEAAAILRLGGEQRLRAFYNCWTRKEAYLKARGVGLTIALERVEVSIDDERPAILALDDDDPAAWTVAALDPGPYLIGALVLRSGREWAVGAVETSSLPLRFDGFRPSHSRSEEQ